MTRRWMAAAAARDTLLADVRKAVKAAGFTNAELAEKLNVSPQYVCDLMKGRRKLAPKIVNAIGEVVAVHPVRWGQWQKMGAQAAGWALA